MTFVKHLLASVTALAVAASGLVAIAPAASAALSSGCQAINAQGSYSGSEAYWQQISGGYTFSTGETLTATFSSPSSTPTTAHIMAGTSAAPGVPASYSSKASTSTFPATLTYTLDQDYTYVKFAIDNGNVNMVLECGTEQTITFANPGDQELTTGTISLTATADSGLTVSFASSTTSVCEVSGTTLTLKTEGTCTITASQAGSGDYLAADDVARSFTVSKSSQTITFANPGEQELDTGSISLSATSSSGLTVSFAASGSCSVSGVTLSLDGLGTCTVTASQSGDSEYAAASDVDESFEIVAAPAGGGGAGGGGISPTPAVAATNVDQLNVTTKEVLQFRPNSDRDGLVAIGNGIKIDVQILEEDGGSNPLTAEEELSSDDPQENLAVEFEGALKENSSIRVTLSNGNEFCTVARTGSAGDRREDRVISIDYAETIPNECKGPWTLTVEGTLSDGEPFTLDAPVFLSPRKGGPTELKAKDSYFFQGKSYSFTKAAPRKLRNAISNIPSNTDVTIEVIGVSTSLKGKKKNGSLAKKRCQAIEGFIAKQRPDLDITFVPSAIGAKEKGGKLPGKEGLARTKNGKPLTTVRWELLAN